MSWGNYGVTFQGKVTLKGMKCEPCQKLWVLFYFVLFLKAFTSLLKTRLEQVFWDLREQM